jgi:alpha-1,2-mannosyltransferase
LRRWVLVRRLYEPRFQLVIASALLAALAAYYAVWSIANWVSLDAAALRFDFQSYFTGAQAAAHGADVYAEFKRTWGTEAWTVAYIYPPFFALLLAPLTGLGLVTAGRVWLIAVHAAFLGSLWLLLRINPELPATGRRLFLAAALAFMPVYVGVKFQQVATLWLLLLTAATWAALRRRPARAGLFLALAASLKVIPVLCIPLFARLGRWRTALSATALLIGITAVSLAAAPGSWQFFTVVLPRIGAGNSNWDNASIDGLVSRLVALDPRALGPATASIAEALVALAAIAILGITLWRARPGGDPSWRLRLGMAATVVALLMVSSVTWQHHLVTLLLPLAIAMAWIAARRPRPGYAWTLALGYALCWSDRRILPLPADQVVHSAGQAALVLAATSIKLAGLVLLWSLLLAMLRAEARLVRLPRASTEGPIETAA